LSKKRRLDPAIHAFLNLTPTEQNPEETMSLLTNLKSAPRKLPPVAIFNAVCGLFYLANGAVIIAWPGIAQALFFEPAFTGHESGLLRVIGMTLAIIGWLYIFGSRSGGAQVAAATVIDRLTIVPLVLFGVALTGTFPHLFLLFAVLDPLLGAIAWWLLSRK